MPGLSRGRFRPQRERESHIGGGADYCRMAALRAARAEAPSTPYRFTTGRPPGLGFPPTLNDNDPAPRSTDGPIPSSELSTRDRRPCEIQLQNPCRYPEAAARRVRPWLAPVVEALSDDGTVPRARSLVVRFVSDREMRRLNAAYRQKDRPTDVLSFPGQAGLAGGSGAAAMADSGANSGADSRADDDVGFDFVLPPADELDEADHGDIAGEGGHLGDIVIAVPTARRQAEERGHGVERELRILMLHGLLHCSGYDHETDQGEMDAVEDRLRERWLEVSA